MYIGTGYRRLYEYTKLKEGKKRGRNRSRVLGEGHAHTVTSMINLASMYSNHGRWKEAESLLVQVIETFKRVLGEEHRLTLTSMNNLAFTWKRGPPWRRSGLDEDLLLSPAASTRPRSSRHRLYSLGSERVEGAGRQYGLLGDD